MEEQIEGLHMTSTWLRPSAALAFHPDRLKTLNLGGRRRKRGRSEGGLNEGDRVTKAEEKGSLHERKKEEGEDRKSCSYM